MHPQAEILLYKNRGQGSLEHSQTKGVPALGIKAKNGVVLATEKKAPSILVDETSMRKIENLCSTLVYH